MSRNIRSLLDARWSSGLFVCVGLDTDFDKIPEWFRMEHAPDRIVDRSAGVMLAYNRAIIDATHDRVCAFKPNSAFYEAQGHSGMEALRDTIAYINDVAPRVPVILDAKRGDIGNTNLGYLESAFGYMNADAITVSPFLGQKALQPFLDQGTKGVFVLCQTSNEGADEFQGLSVVIESNEADHMFDRRATPVMTGTGGPQTTLANHVAYRVWKHWDKNDNCGLVVGATAPHELQSIRRIVGDMPILIPGIGAQGGKVGDVIPAGKDSRGRGMIVNASRSVIFASEDPDFADAARREVEHLTEEIRIHLTGEPVS